MPCRCWAASTTLTSTPRSGPGRKCSHDRLRFEAVLEWARTRQLRKVRGQQRTDATHALAAVRALNRLAVVGGTLRHALDSLAVAAPDWLRPRCQPAWPERSARRLEDADLPKGQAAREAFAVLVRGDGHALLAAVHAPDAPAWLREVPAVELLRRVWVQQCRLDEGAVRWRAADNSPPAAVGIGSPDAADAHDARKGTTSWVGYVRSNVACSIPASCRRGSEEAPLGRPPYSEGKPGGKHSMAGKAGKHEGVSCMATRRPARHGASETACIPASSGAPRPSLPRMSATPPVQYPN